MAITRMSTSTHALDESFLLQYLKGQASSENSELFHQLAFRGRVSELLDQIPEVQIVCNADIAQEDLRVAQLCEAKLLGR